MAGRQIKRQISYKHTLSELSVNRKDPCEVVRELISNSYDAGATQIKIYTLLQYHGFIFFDNGTGISQVRVKNDISPMDAFFSIGYSTKVKGGSVGYKCQGSKLCFACSKFALLTRCEDSQDNAWDYVDIDNPKQNLPRESYTVEPKSEHDPFAVLEFLLDQPDARTAPILNDLKDLFSQFSHGTLIFVKGLEVEDFSKYYGTDSKYPYIYEYIKHYTKHGDVTRLNAESTSFQVKDEEAFKNSYYSKDCSLCIWDYDRAELKEIKQGYPYVAIKKTKTKTGPSSDSISLPSQLKYLRSLRCSLRKAKTFRFEGQTYCLAFAVDGTRTALDFYEALGRQGSSRSGITLSSQQGTFLCSEGIKICEYNQLFLNEVFDLVKFSVLSDPKAQRHFVFMINGSFDLVTNRTSLTTESEKVVQSTRFLKEIESFVSNFYQTDNVFRDLVDRLNGEINSAKIEIQVKKFRESKDNLCKRHYFYVENIDILKDKRFYEPASGEEHGVGALYTVFANLVPDDSPYKKFWLRPLNFAAQGLDSIAEEKPNSTKSLKGLEYKYKFSIDEIFNHPLIITDQIVCWEVDLGSDKGDGDVLEVKDESGAKGVINLQAGDMQDIGFEIKDIDEPDGNYHGSKVIRVVNLKSLLLQTFNCQWRSGF
ncbi:ATP-binding protein [Sodalinema gerasimenkoae]|uniref:ATP-binding protein n=1 Tax=Sodalinema gerasimenkoae TaxID=2862348 RepID=UPI00135B8C9E|nr:ATP-binding protein [Sodalinema gerasimenkoae]